MTDLSGIDLELIALALLIVGALVLTFGMIISAIAMSTMKSPVEYICRECDPWDECPDCEGSGEIDIRDGDKMNCPCTEEWI